GQGGRRSRTKLGWTGHGKRRQHGQLWKDRRQGAVRSNGCWRGTPYARRPATEVRQWRSGETVRAAPGEDAICHVLTPGPPACDGPALALVSGNFRKRLSEHSIQGRFLRGI